MLETILKIDKGELKQIDQSTGKLMTLYKVLHPKVNIDCMCQEKTEEIQMDK